LGLSFGMVPPHRTWRCHRAVSGRLADRQRARPLRSSGWFTNQD